MPMNIVVLVKEVPDTYEDRKLSLETGLADRGATAAVLDEISERSLEVALAYADAHESTNVTVLSVAPEGTSATLRKCLAMGAASAVHVVDDGLLGADLTLTAEVLAEALRRVSFDLVIAGNLSTDGAGGMVPAAIAELLGVAHMTGLSTVDISADAVSGTRPVDGGVQTVSAQLPSVISITEALPDARFANFKGIMAAKKKPLETVSLADLGVDPETPGVARSIMLTVAEKPLRTAGIKIVDEGDAAEQLASFLVENRLV